MGGSQNSAGFLDTLSIYMLTLINEACNLQENKGANGTSALLRTNNWAVCFHFPDLNCFPED